MKRSLACGPRPARSRGGDPGSGRRSSARHAVQGAAAYAPAYNWTGFYLGIQGGGAWGNSDWNGLAVSNSPSGGMIGGTAGYNWQAHRQPVGVRPRRRHRLGQHQGHRHLRRRSPAKPRTTGSAPRAAGSATPGIAGCRTSPAASRSATSTPTAPASRDRATPMSAGPSAWASKASSPATGPPSSNISMRTSATRPAARRRAARRPTSTSA